MIFIDALGHQINVNNNTVPIMSHAFKHYVCPLK